MRVGAFFVKSGSLLLRFGDGGQQPVSLVLVLSQQLLCLLLRQLHVPQLLQHIALLLWQTVAHCSDMRQLQRCLDYCHHAVLVSAEAQRVNIKL